MYYRYLTKASKELVGEGQPIKGRTQGKISALRLVDYQGGAVGGLLNGWHKILLLAFWRYFMHSVT